MTKRKHMKAFAEEVKIEFYGKRPELKLCVYAELNSCAKFYLAAVAQNLKRLVRFLNMTAQPAMASA